MKRFCKKMTAILSTVAALALGVGAGTVGAMLFSNAIQDTEKSDNSNTSSSQSSENGKLTVSFLNNKNFFGGPTIKRSDAGESSPTLTFTISPDDASDKTVVVSSEDESEVTVSKSRVQSGESVTLTLVKQFKGTVNITAYPEILGSTTDTTVTVPVTVFNTVTSLVPYEIGNDVGKCWTSADSSNATATADLSYASYTATDSSKSVVWHSSADTATDELYFTFEAFGYDTGRYPGIDSTYSTLESGKTDDGELYTLVKYALAGDSTSGTYSTTCGSDATFTASEIAYVAPTSLTGSSTSIQYNS